LKFEKYGPQRFYNIDRRTHLYRRIGKPGRSAHRWRVSKLVETKVQNQIQQVRKGDRRDKVFIFSPLTGTNVLKIFSINYEFT